MACDACKAAKTRWGVELAEHFETLGFNGFDHRGLFSRRVAGGVRWDSRCGRNRLFLGGLTATGGEQQGRRKPYCSGVHSCHHGTSLVGRVGGLDEGAAPKRRSFTARLAFESSPMLVSTIDRKRVLLGKSVS